MRKVESQTENRPLIVVISAVRLEMNLLTWISTSWKEFFSLCLRTSISLKDIKHHYAKQLSKKATSINVSLHG